MNQSNVYTQEGLTILMHVMREKDIYQPYVALWQLLCALKHAAEANGQDFDAALVLAEQHYASNIRRGHIAEPF